MRSTGTYLAALILSCALASGVAAAPRDPHIGYVFPAGGRQGTTFQVHVAGQFLENASAVHVSGEGVTAKVVEQEKPPNAKEQDELQKLIADIQEKRRKREPLTAEDLKAADAARKRLEALGRRRNSPSLGDLITLEFTVAADAALGAREIRLAVQGGLSNPVVFQVGDLAEFTETPWLDIRGRGGATPAKDTNPREKKVFLPVTVNGQIPPGTVDRYRFAARAGQRLVAQVRARELIPYIADAVPGWFQAKLALFDAKGKEVAYADDFRFRPDPVLSYEVAADGDYVLEVTDALYRGREDFVYRIDIGELALVTDAFPLGGRVGEKAEVEVSGWNLPFGRLPLDLSGREPGVFALPANRITDLLSFDADTLPEVLEVEPNDVVLEAQRATGPVIVNGRVDRPGDVDVFRVGGGAAGQTLVAEVYARRLGSPLDSVLTAASGSGKQLGFNDDREDKGAGLTTHHADSRIEFAVPSDGVCLLTLADVQGGGGGAYAYRLRVGPPRPDFDLRVTPSSLTVRPGGSVPLTVHVMRRDGFAGEIAVSLRAAPKGFALAEARIAPGQDSVQATLSAPGSATAGAIRLQFDGRAKIGGRAEVRAAVPADDLMQSFAYRHLVPAQELLVVVVGRPRAAEGLRILSGSPVRISPGGTARILVATPALSRAGLRLAFELTNPPEGISIERSIQGKDGHEIVLKADRAKAKPGLTGNLIVAVSGNRADPAAKSPRPAGGRGFPLGSLPAIPFEVVPPQ